MTGLATMPKELGKQYFRVVLAKAGLAVIDGAALSAGYQFRIESDGCVVGWGYTNRDGVTINARKFDPAVKFDILSKLVGIDGITFNG